MPRKDRLISVRAQPDDLERFHALGGSPYLRATLERRQRAALDALDHLEIKGWALPLVRFAALELGRERHRYGLDIGPELVEHLARAKPAAYDVAARWPAFLEGLLVDTDPIAVLVVAEELAAGNAELAGRLSHT